MFHYGKLYHLLTFRWWIVEDRYRGVNVDYYAPLGYLCRLFGHSKKYFEWQLDRFCKRCGAQTNVDDMLDNQGMSLEN